MGRISYAIEPCGAYLLYSVENNSRNVLVQTDWDFPGLASSFGWRPCRCGKTDGTVDCSHKTASQMIAEATSWLDAHVGDITEDPGYFDIGQ
jgi:hypothetical protein